MLSISFLENGQQEVINQFPSTITGLVLIIDLDIIFLNIQSPKNLQFLTLGSSDD